MPGTGKYLMNEHLLDFMYLSFTTFSIDFFLFLFYVESILGEAARFYQCFFIKCSYGHIVFLFNFLL